MVFSVDVQNTLNEVVSIDEAALSHEREELFYKMRKEDLVTGYNGSDKLEVFLICAFLPVTNLL